ncbi:restriction endonuclease [Fodinicurvata fenggangensis]|uniref:restriction endonuclease n=1 Tax=Fodinicurvata fenggangensis TaxID=1121830 RepID=UPI000479304B|nr:restriction endonuclease [Fodinicurvata fenggangensis]
MIPDYQSLMLPVLQEAAETEVSTREVIETLAGKHGLSVEEREQLLPSGRQRIFDNRVHWAKSYLKQAGLVRYTRRGSYIATTEGRKVLAQAPERIDNAFLKQYESFQAFQNRRGAQTPTKEKPEEPPEPTGSTPDEVLRTAHRQINAALAADLLDRVRQATPQFFEDLIIELLLAMGYGGTSEDAARALGQSGDNGVDGVIDQDPLGVDQIYVQAKRYAEGNNVGASDIRDFFGALNVKKAQKGLFFTTSSFSTSAKQTAKELGMRIVLIDGDQLTKLMIRYNVGCRDEEVLHLKRVDEDYFG